MVNAIGEVKQQWKSLSKGPYNKVCNENECWLRGYVYRIEQSVSPCLFAGAFVFIATFISITLQCYKQH